MLPARSAPDAWSTFRYGALQRLRGFRERRESRACSSQPLILMVHPFWLSASLLQADSTTPALGEVRSEGAYQSRCLTATGAPFHPQSGELSIVVTTYFRVSGWGAGKRRQHADSGYGASSQVLRSRVEVAYTRWPGSGHCPITLGGAPARTIVYSSSSGEIEGGK